MPCYGPSPEEDRDYQARERRAAENRLAKTEAMLCALMYYHDTAKGDIGEVLAKLDWKEAGVKRKDLEAWWTEHRALDIKRRARERKEAQEARAREQEKERREELRKQALSKLSLAERRALGIK